MYSEIAARNWKNPGKEESGPIQLKGWPIFPDPDFKTPIFQQSEPLPTAVPTADFQPESKALQPLMPQHTPSPNPDDLLEALTELILKDFRRFYP